MNTLRLDRYIVPRYDVLHTQGRPWLIQDLAALMKARGILSAFYRGAGDIMTANDYLKNYVYDGVIYEYALLKGIPIREAFDALYRSRLYTEIRTGVSDMHCRSDGYLAEELLRETEKAAT